MSTSSLQIQSVIGFSGKVAHSLHYTPCGRYLVYPLGSFVVLKNLVTEKEAAKRAVERMVAYLTEMATDPEWDGEISDEVMEKAYRFVQEAFRECRMDSAEVSLVKVLMDRLVLVQ